VASRTSATKELFVVLSMLINPVCHPESKVLDTGLEDLWLDPFRMTGNYYVNYVELQ
jgi:hypothetical protein